MQFKPEGNRFLWDFWFLEYENPAVLELFYLTAPYDDNPETRHFNANIARATRQKDGSWLDHGIVFSPSSDPNAWDNQATWTGSSLKLKQSLFGYQYIMPYTGVNKDEKAGMQRIGFALSHDGLNWQRDERMPVLEADPECHRLYNSTWNNETAFRDPYLLQLEDGRFALYITTERKDMPEACCGCVSVYISDDLLNWVLQAQPATAKLPFGQMEVPTPFFWDGKWYMIINCVQEKIADNDMGIPKYSGAFCLVSDNPLAGFTYHHMLLGHDQKQPRYYTPKIINNNGKLEIYAWKGYDEGGKFGGYLDGPFDAKHQA